MEAFGGCDMVRVAENKDTTPYQHFSRRQPDFSSTQPPLLSAPSAKVRPRSLLERAANLLLFVTKQPRLPWTLLSQVVRVP